MHELTGLCELFPERGQLDRMGARGIGRAHEVADRRFGDLRDAPEPR